MRNGENKKMKKHNEYYWQNKAGRAVKATQHTQEMAEKYGKEIEKCINETEIYNAAKLQEMEKCIQLGDLTMEVMKTDSVDALFNAKDNGRIAVLNFASYKNPGGGFMVGSRAQEECLCHESFLYNVLKEFEDSYYVSNRSDLNRALYRNKALYSPNVVFEHNDEVRKTDVITCASPNFSAAEKFVKREENNKVMKSRIRFVLEIAKHQAVDTLILGAFGCGVFQQDPEFVSKCFVEEAEEIFGKEGLSIHIIFAVIPPLPNQTDNCTPFEKAVDEWKKNH